MKAPELVADGGERSVNLQQQSLVCASKKVCGPSQPQARRQVQGHCHRWRAEAPRRCRTFPCLCSAQQFLGRHLPQQMGRYLGMMLDVVSE